MPTEGLVQINLRPNPATIELVGSVFGLRSSNYSVEVYDLQGRQKSVEVAVYDDHFLIRVSSLTQGIYILRINSGQRTYFKRFVKT